MTTTDAPRIIVVKFQALGDMIMSTVGIRMLRRAFPDASLSLLTLDLSAQMVEQNPDVDRIVRVPTNTFSDQELLGLARVGHVARAIRRWRRTGYDAVVSFHVGRVPNALIRTLRARQFTTPGQGPLEALVGRGRKSFARGLNHYMEAYPAIARAAIRQLGGSTHRERPAPVLRVSPAESRRAQELLTNRGVTPGEFLAVFPGGGANTGESLTVRQYPGMGDAVARFCQEHPDVDVVLLGGNTDGAPCGAVRAALPGRTRVVDLHGETDLRTFCAVVAVSRALVTTDSVSLHVGGALRIPTVAVFGPTDPAEKVDPDAPITVVAPRVTPPSYFGKFAGDEASARRAFDEISPQQVTDAVAAVWTTCSRSRACSEP